MANLDSTNIYGDLDVKNNNIKQVAQINDITATELSYLDGATNNIQTQLNGRAPLAGPALTGTPTAPTAAINTSTTQLATTAFVLNQLTNVAPKMDGVAAVGTGTGFARSDHIHPSDTSKAAASHDHVINDVTGLQTALNDIKIKMMAMSIALG